MQKYISQKIGGFFVVKNLKSFLALAIGVCIFCSIKADEPKIKTGFLTTSHGQIFYRTAGYDKPGTPILVLHGGPAYPHNYLETLDSLSDKRPVIYYDQMGCGKSGPLTKENWTIDYYVSELAEVVKLLKLDKFHLFGHSWGTIISEEYILKEPPQGLKKVIMSGAFISGRRWRRQ
jgi:proline iminopeptidase